MEPGPRERGHARDVVLGVGLEELLLLLPGPLGFRDRVRQRSRCGAEHGSRVDRIQHVHIPDLNRGVHRTHSDKVSKPRRFALGSALAGRSVSGEIEPFDAERPATEHEIVMDVEVVVGLVVDVVVQGGEVGRGSGGDEDRVRGEDLESFTVDILLFGLREGMVRIGEPPGGQAVRQGRPDSRLP